MTRTVMTVLLFPALALCGCGAPLAEGTGPTARAAAGETEALWIPDDVRHDPAARSSLMEQLRVQIMQKTRAVPEVNRLVVRERLRRQLDRAGFDMEETTYILSSLDEPRAPLDDPALRKSDDVADRGGRGGGSGEGGSGRQPTLHTP